ncbi:MAG: LytR family transcriptional regulator [Chloroflexi bacterium]|nr:LCP family protein [Chloroflexota bacterium]MQC26751.1 LytR family transcriptional regulator [Chloroflexota bacterium]
MDSWDIDDFQPIRVDETQPADPVTSRDLAGDTQAVKPVARARRKRRKLRRALTKPVFLLLGLLALYFFFPWQSKFLVLGIDRVPEGTTQGRSDTMILVGIEPLSAQVNMLSIPRDLWVSIPNYGENRINTAHYFAEAEQPGSGPDAAMNTVKANFDVRVSRYIRIRLEGFAGVIDALGGITISLDAPAAGYPAGEHQLDGTQALAFVRDRTGDDFFRMAHAQLFITAMLKKLINPLSWFRLPAAAIALGQAMDTNVPVWWWPRLGLAAVRALPEKIETRTLDRTMVNGWTTSEGAQVLLPNWEAILPLVEEMF